MLELLVKPLGGIGTPTTLALRTGGP